MSALRIGRSSGVVAVGTIVVDLASKGLVRMALPLCAGGPSLSPCPRIPIAGPIDLVPTENHATAFGLVGGPWLLVALTVALIVMAGQARSMPPGTRILFGLGLQVGGLVGNLIDRAMFGGVTDFIHIGAGDRGLFLNPADLALVVGCVIVGVGIWHGVPPSRTQPSD